MNQKGLPDKVIGPAQVALDYYKQNGFFEPAARASLLLIRAQRDHGQYQSALQSGNEFLALATKSDMRELRMEAEEVVGTVFLAKEHYSDALVHFQNAESFADTNSMRASQKLHCSDALWKLGRYSESEILLSSLSGHDSFMEGVDSVHIASLLSRREYETALTLSREMIAKDPKMASYLKLELEQDEAIAESHLGLRNQALEDLTKVVGESTNDAEDEAKAKLSAAEVYLALGLRQQAYDNAVPAQIYFASSGQQDSELRSALLAAVASKELKNTSEYSKYSVKVVDIISQLQHTYDPQGLQFYLSRPDLRTLRQEVSETAG